MRLAGATRTICKIIADTPNHELFSGSFNPNKIARRQVRKMCKRSRNGPRVMATKLTKMFGDFRSSVPEIKFYENGKSRTRRAVFAEIGRAIGPFRSKNLFQLLKLGFPDAKCFLARRRDEPYTECGPGARTALNYLSAFHPQFARTLSGQPAADTYNAILLRFMKSWRQLARQLLPDLAEAFKSHCEFFLQMDETDFQFILCELSKIIQYLLHGSSHYLRRRDPC